MRKKKMNDNVSSVLSGRSRGEKIVFAIVFAIFVLYAASLIYPFVWAFIKSQILCAGPRVFRSENLYCKILNEKEKNIYD